MSDPVTTVSVLLDTIRSEAERGQLVLPVTGPTDGRIPPGWTIEQIRDGLEVLLANYAVILGATASAVLAARTITSTITPALLMDGPDSGYLLAEDGGKLLMEGPTYEFDFLAYVTGLPDMDLPLAGIEELVGTQGGVVKKTTAADVSAV